MTVARVVLALALLAGALPGVAEAHITVVPDRAKPGETATVAFHVVNERDAASTVNVQVFLPAGTALATVRVKPHAGWTSTVQRANGATEIEWSADRARSYIGGETSQDFTVTLGPLPKTDRMVFKALQFYSDGQIVRWIQDPTPDAERPAPALALSAAGRIAPDNSRSGSSSLAFAILAAVLVLAMIAGVVATRRRRSG